VTTVKSFAAKSESTSTDWPVLRHRYLGGKHLGTVEGRDLCLRDCDVACSQAGFGYAQWLLMLVSGLGLVADAAELLVIPSILPSAEVELCINTSQKTWLSKYSAVLLHTPLTHV
jgi:hypothetical protein